MSFFTAITSSHRAVFEENIDAAQSGQWITVFNQSNVCNKNASKSYDVLLLAQTVLCHSNMNHTSCRRSKKISFIVVRNAALLNSTLALGKQTNQLQPRQYFSPLRGLLCRFTMVCIGAVSLKIGPASPLHEKTILTNAWHFIRHFFMAVRCQAANVFCRRCFVLP